MRRGRQERSFRVMAAIDVRMRRAGNDRELRTKILAGASSTSSIRSRARLQAE